MEGLNYSPFSYLMLFRLLLNAVDGLQFGLFSSADVLSAVFSTVLCILLHSNINIS